MRRLVFTNPRFCALYTIGSDEEEIINCHRGTNRTVTVAFARCRICEMWKWLVLRPRSVTCRYASHTRPSTYKLGRLIELSVYLVITESITSARRASGLPLFRQARRFIGFCDVWLSGRPPRVLTDYIISSAEVSRNSSRALSRKVTPHDS